MQNEEIRFVDLIFFINLNFVLIKLNKSKKFDELEKILFNLIKVAFLIK